MAAELPRPGVQVLQTFKKPAPSFVRPTLVPCVVGAAFEVINILSADGTINQKALYGSYTQLGKTITHSGFPDHRQNLDELVILAPSIKPFLLSSRKLSALPMSPGEGFLATAHWSGKAALNSNVFVGATGLALNGLTFSFCIDNPVRTDTSKDVSLVFVGSGNLTSAQAAAQINAAAGQTVAFVTGAAPNDLIQLRSPTFGCTSSVTVRGGQSANAVIGLGYATAAVHEERVEGSGFRGQDQSNNTTQTSWIEYFRGQYYVDGTVTAFPARAGLIDVITNTFTTGQHADATFTGGSATIPLLPGDKFFVDGVQLKGGEISKVEAKRFRMGTINTALSTVDTLGNYITKVYNQATVGTILDPSPFSPDYAYFRASGLTSTATPTAAAVIGTIAGTAAATGVINGIGALAGPLALTGLRLHAIVTVDGVATETTYTFTSNPATMAAAAALITIPGVVATATGATPPQLVLTTSKVGANQSITVKGDGTANTILGLTAGSDTTVSGTDLTITGMGGTTLSFTLSKNPHVFNVVFTSDSVVQAVLDINAVIPGVASIDVSGTHLQLSSLLKGVGGSILVNASTGATAVGLAAATASGTGRPLPDVYLDGSSNLVVNSQLLRDVVTGFPLDQDTNPAQLFIQYKALRNDVSALAEVAGVLRIADPDTLTAVLDPITEDNPLALGLFLAMLNAPNFEVKGLGIDDVSDPAQTGTAPAWARAAALLEAEEIYAIAPLTQDETVHGLWTTHVNVMSDPTQAGERIVFLNKNIPTRANSQIALSGTSANSTGTANQLMLDANPAAGLVALGINPSAPITEAMQVYCEFDLPNGTLVRYLVSTVSGPLVSFNLAPVSNADGYFTTANLPASFVVGSSYALKVRGVSLAIPGSNPSRLDYSLVASNVSDANASIKNRRVYSVFPDTVTVNVGGIDKSLPGFYACAAIVGMVAAKPPQQGFTNYPIVGVNGVSGTEKFTRKQLNVLAGGGTYILAQDVPGGAVYCRHQVSTDLTSVETRELSITKVVDFVAKFLRLGVRRFIGTNNISKQLLDTIGTTIGAILKFLEEIGVINGWNLNNIVQDASSPDAVLVDVTLDVPFPCNYIRLILEA